MLWLWHPAARPDELDLDDGIRWTRRDILIAESGGPFDDEGAVAFEAFFRQDGTAGSMRERSRFVRENRI